MEAKLSLLILIMQKLYSQLIGMPVVTEYSPSPVCLVRDVVIDPETGKVVALRVKRDSVIAPLDIERINNAVIIADQDRIIPLHDILRVKNVIDMNIPVIGQRVIAERSKTLLGRVVDYEIDTTHMTLHSIHVAKVFFFFRFQELIISSRSIVKISRSAITVKNTHAVCEREKSGARSVMPAVQ